MALSPKYRVATAMQPLDPASNPILEGTLVVLTAAGVSTVNSSSRSGDEVKVYGIAADNFQTNASSMPGIYPGWQNRVSDGFDETKASGKITVYHSGGEFVTDQFDNGTPLDTTKIGTILISSSVGLLKYGYADVATAINASAVPIGQLTLNAGPYPSGVPGVDVNGDMALLGANTNQYIEFKLLV